MDAEFEKQYKKELQKRFPEVSGADLLKDARYKGVGKADIEYVRKTLHPLGCLNKKSLETAEVRELHGLLDEIDSVRKKFYEEMYEDTKLHIICEMAMLYLENLIAVVEEREKKKKVKE